jgi:putative ABC transport system permease protein
MGILHRVSQWASRSAHREEVEQDLDNEVTSYVELLAQEKMRDGVAADEARRAALLEVEGTAQLKEKVRQARTGAWLGQVAGDLRYGARLLRKDPGFALVMVLTLALGIGANSAIFSVLYAVLLKPLPYSNPHELVRVWQSAHALGFDQLGLTEGQFVSLRDQKRFLSSLAAYKYGRGFIAKDKETDNVFVARASAGVLETLGVRPLLGRDFQRQDEVQGAPPVALLSYELWQHWYGGAQDVLGRSIRVNDKQATIIGVLPKGFYLPEDFVGSETIQVWTPLTINSASPQWVSFNFLPVARLRAGVTPEQTLAELRPYFEQLYLDHPIPGNTLQSIAWGMEVKNLHDDIVGGVQNALWILACAVGVVLLMVCANVASLMLARSAARQKEIAVRAALGAQGSRILRQLLTESVLLSIIGGGVGLLLAHWGLKLITGLAAYNVPRLDQVALNGPVLLFTVIVSVLTGLIFGTLPALQASKPNLAPSLVQEGRGTSQGQARSRAQRSLVVIEVAFAVVLLASAGLLLRSFERMLHVDPGFRTSNVLALEMDLPPTRYTEPDQVATFVQQVMARTRTVPGIENAAITTAPPLSGAANDTVFDMEGQTRIPNMQQHIYLWQITPDYFKTMGIPLISGRELEDSDAAGRAPVIVINDAMARQFWPNRNPVGQHIRFYSDVKVRGDWVEIVGVVHNAPMRRLNEETLPEVFMTYAQGKQITPWVMSTTLVVRSSQDPRLLLKSIREQVRSVDSSAVVRRPQTGDDLIGQTVSQPHFNMVLLGVFAGVALALAAVGIYGILANMVRQRAREIGIRLAMGARRADVFRLVVGRGMRLAGVGLAIGVLLALLCTRLLSGLIFGITSTDPVTYALVVGVISVTAFLSCYLPARKATRLDPMITLRHE